MPQKGKNFWAILGLRLVLRSFIITVAFDNGKLLLKVFYGCLVVSFKAQS